MDHLITVSWLALTVLGAGGCESADDDAAAAQAFCDRLFPPVVAKLSGCCTGAEQMTPEYQLGVAYVQALEGYCDARIPASISSGRAGWESPQATQCENLLRQGLAGPCAVGSFDLSRAIALLCREVVVGHQPAGEPCVADYECSDGLTCIGYGAPGDGACALPPAIGSRCGAAPTDGGAPGFAILLGFGLHPACASGAWCSGGVCAARLAAGQPCLSDLQCAAGLRCHLQVCSSEGPAAIGGPCRGDGDCGPGAYCELAGGSVGACAARKPAGSSCSFSATAPTSECFGACAPQQSCVSVCGSG